MAVARRDPKVAIAGDYLAQARTTRRPQHRFNLRLLPYQIQPFLLAPVIPGETFTSMMLQSQVWSDPLKPTLKNVGWWLQYNFFYVRHRDLPSETRNLLAAMLLNPETDISALLASTDDRQAYTHAGAMDWTRMCLDHVVSEYFRDEGEDASDYTAYGLPIASIYGRGQSDGIERLTLDADYEDRRVDLIDSDGHLYANDLNTMLGHWAALRDAGLTEMDYQDFMKTYGSTVREDEESPNLHRAEDIWALREFTYPTNTVEPTNGIPAVAAGWRTQKTGGKRIFCDEPGFIFGVMYTRPKVYMRNQLGSLAGSMADVKSWLPAMLHGDVDLGHLKWPQDEGPFADVFNDDYWIDIRDLLLYGDQFINYDPDGEVPFLNLPAADATRRYAAESEVRTFFVDDEAGKFEADGICSINVLGRQKPTTSGLVLGKA